ILPGAARGRAPAHRLDSVEYNGAISVGAVGTHAIGVGVVGTDEGAKLAELGQRDRRWHGRHPGRLCPCLASRDGGITQKGTGTRERVPGAGSSIRRYVDTSTRRHVETSIRRYVDTWCRRPLLIHRPAAWGEPITDCSAHPFASSAGSPACRRF